MVTTSFLVDVARAHGIFLSLISFRVSATPCLRTSSPSAAARLNSDAISALSTSYLSSSPYLPSYIRTNSFFAASRLSPRAAMQKPSIFSIPYLPAIFCQLLTTSCSESRMTPSISNTTAPTMSSPPFYSRLFHSELFHFKLFHYGLFHVIVLQIISSVNCKCLHNITVMEAFACFYYVSRYRTILF